ncbi:hypothetical protein [Streptomyces sp. NL15-2K]|nr:MULTISPECIES: hypothetical protein [Actinomycetes]WKX06532.1 hypothetical protein Q4V64_03100 [Kutzneria buriramensis]GCB43542.1 hypothetical protein SNL152K_827 [Streptomyces sp. NL15-2K]
MKLRSLGIEGAEAERSGLLPSYAACSAYSTCSAYYTALRGGNPGA